MAGNNNPDLLRKLETVLLNMKNNILISMQKYKAVLEILREVEIKKI